MQQRKLYPVVLDDECSVSKEYLASLISGVNGFRLQTSVKNRSELGDNTDIMLCSYQEFKLAQLQKLKSLISRAKGNKIIVYSKNISFTFQLELFQLGVNGILTKMTQEIIEEALNTVIRNGQYYDIELKNKLISTIYSNHKSDTINSSFSNMQRDILQLLVQDLTSKQVAENLCRSQRTIEWHKQKMMETVGVKSTTQLLLFAIEHRIIDSPFRTHQQHP